MKEKYIQGIYNEYAGKLDQRLADLEVLLTGSVGVGEHGNISAEIKRTLEDIDKYQSLVDTVRSIFSAKEETPDAETEE